MYFRVEMLSYTEFGASIKITDIENALCIIQDGFNPTLEFSPETMDHILSKDYLINSCPDLKVFNYKKRCSVDECFRVEKRNRMCKPHNLLYNKHEKCSVRKCNNLREINSIKKKNNYCYKHK